MKILFILVCSVAAGGAWAFDDDLKCNLKTCGLDLLDFNDFSFGALIRKVHSVMFCIRECSPPVVHEFLQSISFAFTQRIAGKCRHMDCAAHNRFIALSVCAKKEAWPLVQCTKILFDLIQLPLEPVDPVNTTCSVVIETTQCLQETFKRCGQRTYGLVAEILDKPLKLGLNTFCHQSHKDQAKDLLPNPLPLMDFRADAMVIDDETDLAPVAKKLRIFGDPNSSSKMAVPFLTVVACLVAAIATSLY